MKNESIIYRPMRIAMSSVLCIATVGVVVAYSHAVAYANSCVSSHANVIGYDAGPFNSYGNKGYIYINTSATLGNLHDAIWRSFIVAADAGDYVEFGWTEQPQAGINSPTPAADWFIDGQPSLVSTFNFTLKYNTDVRFRIENVGTSNIWRFVIDGQPSPIGYSPVLEFGTGVEQTNSEHYNSCDSMWTHMWDLSFSLPQDAWNSGYQDLEQDCSLDQNGGGWLFDKISNSELQVNNTKGTSC